MASNSAPPKISNTAVKEQTTRSIKSGETACSSNSSCFFQRRKPVNPLANPLLRGALPRSTSNTVRQRVLSAKVLRMKSIQNQLNDANFHLAEVMRENQALKNLQKRQDKALTKYEGANAELPRLIKSHEEDIRFLTEKNKALRKTVKELNEQLKARNDECSNLQEELRHFHQLDRDKRLLEREKLVEQIEDYKVKCQKADSEIVLLNRKLMLESKSAKQRLGNELQKHKHCQRELAMANVEIARLTKLLEITDKTSSTSTNTKSKRFSTLIPRQTMSMVTLNGTKSDTPDEEPNPVTAVKLEPIKDDQNPKAKAIVGILKCPSENIKARLSSSGTSSSNLDDNQSVESNSSSTVSTNNKKSRPNSSQKLEKIETALENTIKKIESSNHSRDRDIDRHLGEYCRKAIDSVKNYTSVIEHHKEHLESARADTDILLESIKEAETMEMKLKHHHMMSFESNNMTDDNLDFVNQILTDEIEFKRKYKDHSLIANQQKGDGPNHDSNNNHGHKKDTGGVGHDKKKLLATLRAIDNGDSVEFEGGDSQRTNQLMDELFGNGE